LLATFQLKDRAGYFKIRIYNTLETAEPRLGLREALEHPEWRLAAIGINDRIGEPNLADLGRGGDG
jgi:hypothetical protein